VLEAAGVKDVLTKCLGSRNHFNVVYAALTALRSLRLPEDVSRLRGKPVELARQFGEVAKGEQHVAA
jgi:small subunit ribosomal protein S5